MKAEQNLRSRLHSITARYNAGYLLLLLLIFAVFLASFFSNSFLCQQYEQTIDQLLSLNELFTDVEDTNRYVYDYYSFLRTTSSAEFRREQAVTQTDIDKMMRRLQADYSRETMDLCCMIQSYLDKSGELVARLDECVAAGKTNLEGTELEEAYAETQDIVNYISKSFREVYSAKLSVTQQERVEIHRVRDRLVALQIGMLVLAVVVCVGFFRQIVYGIALSVRKLTAFAIRVTQGPAAPQEHVEISTGDELEILANAFNEMVDTIHAQFDRIEQDNQMREQLQQVEIENLRISSALQSSQMKLLQSRINPHFLFNTLNMIVQTAYMEDAEETAHLMEVTAEMMRYNLGKLTKAVTMRDEIEHTRNYTYIQQCRFGSRIDFCYEVDESCVALEVPCLILQPLVENSITHGVGLLPDGGRVTVRLYRGEGDTRLEVEDNGAGIPPERLAALQASFQSAEEGNSHIGLHNVYCRLHLYFGDAFHFEISSRPGRTMVRISISGAVPALPAQEAEP